MNDVSRVLINVLKAENNLVRNQIFNVGGNKENYRIIDIIKKLKKKIPINFEFSNKNEDKRNYKVSFKKIKKILKFIPKDNLKSTISLLIKKYQKIYINEKNMNYYNDKKIIKILGKNN